MADLLNVLLIEDSEGDAFLVIRALLKGDIHPVWERVQTTEAFKTLLTTRTWDVIIADYFVPGVNAPEALEIVKQSQLDIPFIVVSGVMGEQVAVEMMKSGAHDYLMKDNLTRLPEALRREVRETKVRAERKQAEITVKQQITAIEAAFDGISILQKETYLYVNQAHLELFGYNDPKELVGESWRQLYPPEEIERLESEIFPIIMRERAWQGEAIASRKDGSVFIQGLSLTLTEDELLICVSQDISDLKKAQEQIFHNATHDPLTNLPNRSLFIERLNLAINKNKRDIDYHYAVLFLDLDRFKFINDSLGHSVGDQLLIGIAQRLITHVRNIDLVARLGGDEFVILLEDIDNVLRVTQITERILDDCQIPFIINGLEIFSNISIGIALGEKGYYHADNLLRDADVAMYRAKQQEKSSYKFFSPDMHTLEFEHLRLETELQKAIEREELFLQYQPIFNLQNNQLTGFEALVRWEHPTRGLIFPNKFIPVAEQTGLILKLDNWVLNTACHQLAHWKNKYPNHSFLTISINITAVDLHKKNLIKDIDTMLAKTELDGRSIILEITESMLIEDIDHTIGILNQIEERNIQISIDDFGTGYSSLNYLHRLPVNNIKIDHSFINDIQEDPRNHQVVSTIIALSDQLELSSVAEGIESPEQLKILQKLNCQMGQGYLFAKPLFSQEIEAQFLASEHKQYCSL